MFKQKCQEEELLMDGQRDGQHSVRNSLDPTSKEQLKMQLDNTAGTF